MSATVAEAIREFETGATRDVETGKVVPTGFLSPLALLVFCEYMNRHRLQKDGKLRSADNWKKGMPQQVYFESLGRHFLELWLHWEGPAATVYPGEEAHSIDDTLCAILFNVQGLLHERALGRDVGSQETQPIPAEKLYRAYLDADLGSVSHQGGF